jgi:hypothetical protein
MLVNAFGGWWFGGGCGSRVVLPAAACRPPTGAAQQRAQSCFSYRGLLQRARRPGHRRQPTGRVLADQELCWHLVEHGQIPGEGQTSLPLLSGRHRHGNSLRRLGIRLVEPG